MSAMTSLLEVREATIAAAGGRVLFEDLSLRLSREHVALVGRNGVGKSTLLAFLAEADPGDGVRTRTKPHYVPQAPPSIVLDPTSNAVIKECRAAGIVSPNELLRKRVVSAGERRKLALVEAKLSGADTLLLDEPTEDLDDDGVAWLRRWLREWRDCLVVASHDRRLLHDFSHFFIASEAGCRYFAGALEALEDELVRAHDESERRYVQSLERLVAYTAHTEHVARRKERKKRYGRCSELDRATSRMRLNQKRSDAQVSHGRAKHVREGRLDAMSEWTKTMRRAIGSRLLLELGAPMLPEHSPEAIIILRDVAARAEERTLFSGIDLELGRQRLAIVGPNGAGKTTLLDIIAGERVPEHGSARRDLSRIGRIAQGGRNFMLDDSLVSLSNVSDVKDLVAHKFPLALAERPLRSLSPGERARAALICLFRGSPPIEVLVLDEPTYSLDLVGQRAMIDALRAWPGGLVVASHDRAFLSAIGIDTFLEL